MPDIKAKSASGGATRSERGANRLLSLLAKLVPAARPPRIGDAEAGAVKVPAHPIHELAEKLAPYPARD